jgi:uncharacterized protein (UPF0262 family)
MVGFSISTEENMKTNINAIRPQSDTIKLMDSEGAITEVMLASIGPCRLERYIFGVRLVQDVVLEDNDAARSWILKMAALRMMVFKIAE